jgi:hypothetical protein
LSLENRREGLLGDDFFERGLGHERRWPGLGGKAGA